MAITNIMVCIYCFRRNFTSKGIVTYIRMAIVCLNKICLYFCYTCIGKSSELRKPTKDTINPAYRTITGDHCKEPIEEPVGYEEVKKPAEVKMTQNPAYALP